MAAISFSSFGVRTGWVLVLLAAHRANTTGRRSIELCWIFCVDRRWEIMTMGNRELYSIVHWGGGHNIQNFQSTITIRLKKVSNSNFLTILKWRLVWSAVNTIRSELTVLGRNTWRTVARVAQWLDALLWLAIKGFLSKALSYSVVRKSHNKAGGSVLIRQITLTARLSYRLLWKVGDHPGTVTDSIHHGFPTFQTRDPYV